MSKRHWPLLSLGILILALGFHYWPKAQDAVPSDHESAALVKPAPALPQLTAKVEAKAPVKQDPIVTSTIEASLDKIRQIERVRGEIKANPHRTPPGTIRAARAVGEVESLEETHPEALPQIQEFYLNCSRDEEAITVIRVQCLQRYVRSKDLSEDEAAALVDSMPAYVRRVYALL